MLDLKAKPYTKALKETMHRKSEILSKAQVFWEVDMTETGATALVIRWPIMRNILRRCSMPWVASWREQYIGSAQHRVMRRRGIRVER